MSRESYADSRLLNLERPHRERQYRTLEALELLLDQRMTALEGELAQHLAEHKRENKNADLQSRKS